MKIPISTLSSQSGELSGISDTMRRLATGASLLNASISLCYGAGGVRGQAGAVATKMRAQAKKLSHLSDVAADAATRYGKAQDEIYSAVFALGGESVSGSPTSGNKARGGGGGGGGRARGSSRKQRISLLGGVKIAAMGLKSAYDQHTVVYDVVEYGKCAYTGAKGIGKIVASVGLAFTGVGIPVAIVGIISGGNDVINASVDATAVYTDQYDQVGKTNLLKDTLVGNAGDLGEMLGNREVGEKVGGLVYHSLDLIELLTDIEKMQEAYGKVKVGLTGEEGSSFLFGDTSFDKTMDNQFDGLKKFSLEETIKSDILEIDPSSTLGLISDAADETYNVVDGAADLYEDVDAVANDNEEESK